MHSRRGSASNPEQQLLRRADTALAEAALAALPARFREDSGAARNGRSLLQGDVGCARRADRNRDVDVVSRARTAAADGPGSMLVASPARGRDPGRRLTDNLPDASRGIRFRARAVSSGKWRLIGRLHPLLIHFPIALVIVAVAAESASVHDRRRPLAIPRGRPICARPPYSPSSPPPPGGGSPRPTRPSRVRCSSGIAGWERRRRSHGRRRPRPRGWNGRIGSARFGSTDSHCSAAAGLVGLAGHLGGLLVWGVNYFRP